MSSFDKQNKQAREKMAGVNIFIRDAKLTPELGKSVRAYFEYSVLRKNNGLFSYDADEILGELSTTLKNEVIMCVEDSLINNKIPFLKGKPSFFVADTIQFFQPWSSTRGTTSSRRVRRPTRCSSSSRGGPPATTGTRR